MIQHYLRKGPKAGGVIKYIWYSPGWQILFVNESASGKTVILTDGTTHKRDKILMVPHNTVKAAKPEKNVIKVATKKHKDKLYFKREDLNEANVIEGKRNRTKKT